MEVRQGEQYSIPIKITSSNSVVITPSNVEDMRIKINGLLKTYSDEELTFDTTNNYWLYPVTEDMTIEFGRYVTVEASALFASGDILKTPVVSMLVSKTTITEMWEEE